VTTNAASLPGGAGNVLDLRENHVDAVDHSQPGPAFSMPGILAFEFRFEAPDHSAASVERFLFLFNPHGLSERQMAKTRCPRLVMIFW
jgi:hypothetical protein